MKTFTFAMMAASAMAADKTALVGTNIGGWMVLEPWITPSMFYRFLGKTHSDGIGTDQYTFCEALGPELGNKVLKAHWDEWIKEDLLFDLAKKGVEVIRVPYGDWTMTQYGPYVGCTDGAKEKLEWLLETADKAGLKVWFDLHAIEGSQNGYDNSGLSNHTEWVDETHYQHWKHQTANWMGEWDVDTMKYTSTDVHKVQHTIDEIEKFIKHFSQYPAFYAFEPVNEPLAGTDLPLLKWFYRNVRQILRTYRPDAQFVFHESYHYDAETWNDLFSDYDMDNVILDTHQYLAFGAKFESDVMVHCDNFKEMLAPAKKIKYPVWVGEWAIATDTCAHWLNGFNDHRDAFAQKCAWVDCPKSYLPDDLAVDFDREADILGPFGGDTTLGAIQKGQCMVDSEYYSKQQTMQLAKCMVEAFNDNVAGHFIWAAKNEMQEERWSYTQAFDAGYLDPSVTFELPGQEPSVFTQ